MRDDHRKPLLHERITKAELHISQLARRTGCALTNAAASFILLAMQSYRIPVMLPACLLTGYILRRIPNFETDTCANTSNLGANETADSEISGR